MPSKDESAIEMNKVNASVHCTNVQANYNKRSVLAQVLAGSAYGIIFLAVGATFAITPLIIADLTSKNDTIIPTAYELSWLGSIGSIVLSISSLLSGILANKLGRKKSVLFVIIPNIAAWILVLKATNINMLFAAAVLFGFSDGMTISPSLTYMVEICEPSLRGYMLTYLNLFTGVGAISTYFLGTILPWRMAATIVLCFPITGAVAIFMIPESPISLIARGRNEDAMKSLCWLRGWVKKSDVKEEFRTMVMNYRKSLKCTQCSESDTPLMDAIEVTCTNCKNTENNLESMQNIVKALLSRDTARPLIIIVLVLYFSSMSSHGSIMPSKINYFRAYNVPLDAHWAMVGVSILHLTGGSSFIALLRFFGKRTIEISGMLISATTTLSLGIYAYKYIPHNLSTYDHVEVVGEPSYLALILFVILSLSHYTAIFPVGLSLPSETLPSRTRVYAVGICGTIHGIFNFIATKIHIHLEYSVGIYGAFFVYTAFTYVGALYVYLFVVETEKRKLEDIQADYSGSRINIFPNDCFIRKFKRIFSGMNTESINEPIKS